MKNEEFDSYEDMDLIDITLKHYPDNAKKGYIFVANVDRKLDLISCLSNYENELLKIYRHFEPEFAIGLIELSGYLDDGTEDKELVPIFVKVTNPDILKRLSKPNKLYINKNLLFKNRKEEKKYKRFCGDDGIEKGDIFDIIDMTLKHYPEMARKNFVFATNINRKESIFYRLFLRFRLLRTYKNFRAIYSTIQKRLPAYWRNGTEDKGLVPVFVKATNPDTLKRLSNKN